MIPSLLSQLQSWGCTSSETRHKGDFRWESPGFIADWDEGREAALLRDFQGLHTLCLPALDLVLVCAQALAIREEG